MKTWIFTFGLGFCSLLYLTNASRFAPAMEGSLTLISHRGVYQRYDREGVGNMDCTATRIFRPTHDYLENTLRSMEAAFAAGADIVEIDIHPTADDEFMVFHDWTVDCRTNGKGVTREQTSEYLKSLDIGHGYTFDGGITYPFRGRGIGEIPTLSEVLSAFPTQHFLINLKSNDEWEATAILEYLDERNLRNSKRLQFYGGGAPIKALQHTNPELVYLLRGQVKSCLIKYLLIGWTSYVPTDCRNSAVIIPSNMSKLLWGWPNRFMQRMHDAGTDVGLAGPRSLNARSTVSVDTPVLQAIPEGFSGSLWLEEIERVGPVIKKKVEPRRRSYLLEPTSRLISQKRAERPAALLRDQHRL